MPVSRDVPDAVQARDCSRIRWFGEHLMNLVDEDRVAGSDRSSRWSLFLFPGGAGWRMDRTDHRVRVPTTGRQSVQVVGRVLPVPTADECGEWNRVRQVHRS